MCTHKGHRNPPAADFSAGVLGVWLLAGLLFLASTGCGVKAPPVPPDVKPPAVATFTHTLADGTLSLSWALSGNSPTPRSYTLYRSRTPLAGKPCPNCPLLFKRVRTIPADNRDSGAAVLTVEPGYRYGFKMTATAENGFEGPDSRTILFNY